VVAQKTRAGTGTCPYKGFFNSEIRIPNSEFLIGGCPKSSRCRFTFALLLTSSHFFKYNTRGKGEAISLAFIFRKKMKRKIGLIRIWCVDGFAEGYGG
jgi:hypothetical protein